MTLSKRVLYDGSDTPLLERRALRAGPLSLIYETGDLRYIALCDLTSTLSPGALENRREISLNAIGVSEDHEILRRIYVAVRDRNWDTVPATLSNVHFDIRARTFHITYDAVHQYRDIDFCWRGTLTGDAQGTITFTMDGVARSTFLRNRIGFCVLHPMQACAGRSCAVEHSDGTVERGRFPSAIAPHQPFLDIRAITYAVRPGLRAEVRFSGDVFEMEDQRNWTDASYKTYSTPLALPFPVEVTADTRITQRVTLTLKDAMPATSPPPTGAKGHTSRQQDILNASSPPGRTEGGETSIPPSTAAPCLRSQPQAQPLKITIGHTSLGPLPRIGLGVASHNQPLNAQAVTRLKALHLAHLRVDVPLTGIGEDTDAGILRRAVAEARHLNVPLEIALFLSDNASQELSVFVKLLARLSSPVCRWLIFHTEEKSTMAPWIRLAREHLTPYAPTVPIMAGTNAYFAELNRQHPPLELVDGVCYAITPQVHAFDNLSLIETLPTQAVTVASARQFVGNLPIVVSPVTLRPRFNPNATEPSPPTKRMAGRDVRQMSLLGAGWTLGSLKHLAESGVASVTYYETTGWRGVMETAESNSQSESLTSLPSAVFPLYHVLAAVGDFSDGETLAVTSENAPQIPAPVEALALHQGHRLGILLANLMPAVQHVIVRGLQGPVKVRYLDERNAERAMIAPEAFQTAKGEQLDASREGIGLRLLPYAGVRIDSSTC